MAIMPRLDKAFLPLEKQQGRPCFGSFPSL